MRDDLLHAQASVEWAVANLPALQERVNAWLKANVSVGIKELDADHPNNIVIATQKEPLALSLIVEAGAYINAIRSSLDILATTLAYRHGIPHPESVYFPIVRSLSVFRGRDHFKGKELIEGLPHAERAIIESLEPYKGGHKLLWPLHQLDIIRKHRRLLGITMKPASLSIIGHFKRGDFTPIATGWINGGNGETILGLFAKGGAKPKVKVATYISLNESEFPDRIPIGQALDQFAGAAHAIIGMFDR